MVIVLTRVILVVVLLAIAAISALRARRTRHSGQTTPPPRVGAPNNGGQAPSPAARLLLVAVETVDAAFVLDGVVVDDGSPLGPVGWPVALRLRRPETPALDESARAMLARWVAEDEIVHLAITANEPRRRVWITNGASVLHFDPVPVDDQRPRASGQ